MVLRAEWLTGEVLAPVAHHQWEFTVPRRLRLVFLYDRRLLGAVSRCALLSLRTVLRMIATTTLSTLARRAELIRTVRKSELRQGDRLIVETRNSSYHIVALGNGLFRVSGGWFNRKGMAPATTTISGCTWGGSAIHVGLAAGLGLFLEFGNRVLTTRIQRFRLIPADDSGTVH